ncbi:hypothetical protein [Deinococcus multiflagellatus]|uniref:FIST domain-containing protein n=1 Tax=Deinococcus multiflagellatus TaxID=1656887 RepID=A0ABW1ZT79_9DEIO
MLVLIVSAHTLEAARAVLAELPPTRRAAVLLVFSGAAHEAEAGWAALRRLSPCPIGEAAHGTVLEPGVSMPRRCAQGWKFARACAASSPRQTTGPRCARWTSCWPRWPWVRGRAPWWCCWTVGERPVTMARGPCAVWAALCWSSGRTMRPRARCWRPPP